MSGFTFLFSAALWALPLAALPVVLHLLFRRKSPVVFFSTIRFIQASVQRTAARKRVQKWLLLAVRIVLLALLIAAVAQPAKVLSGAWASPGKSSIAAIVVDTSYSMMVMDHGEPLLAKADAAARELLGAQLANTKAAIFRGPPPGEPERLTDAAEILGQWTPLAPQANPRPLVDRVASAVDLLNREHADDRWLVVISDLQKREFPSPLPIPKGAHVVLIDLHPDDPRTAGITRVAVEPSQPTPGVDSEAVVDMTGRPNTSRPVTLSVSTPAGNKLLDAPVQVATLDAAGHARMRFRVRLPVERWMMLNAALADEDDMAWDNSRSRLIETPPRQIVNFLGTRPTPSSNAYPAWIALDPSEGAWPQGWSLTVNAVNDVTADANVAVLLAEDWPDETRGGTFRVSCAAGARSSCSCDRVWKKPGASYPKAAAPPWRPCFLPNRNYPPAWPRSIPFPWPLKPMRCSPVFAPERFHEIIVRRLIPFSTDPQATPLLTCFPQDPRPGLRPAGLLYRKPLGSGTIYTVATLPESQFTNFALHPLFLPLMVRMAQRPPQRGDARNIELGQPITLAGRQYDALASVTIQGPRNDTTIVKPDRAGGIIQFPFGPAAAPGLYTWLKPASNEAMAITNVQLPASESELFYTPAQSLADPADNVMIARSVNELASKVISLAEPRPQWGLPIAIVLLMLCLEALMASLTRLWKPIRLRGFAPKAAGIG